MYAVTFNNVRKRLGDFELNIPKLAIRQGYMTGFIGENGAGKTTTIKLILDMLQLDEGSIEVLGKNIKGGSVSIHQEIGYVGEPTGYPEETPLEAIKDMLALFYKNWDEVLYKSYMQFFNLNSKQKYKDLSTGQKKQFAMIMALSHHPKLILLDEPTSGLDPVVRNEILDILMDHMQNEEVTIFYSTHITSDLEKAGDYIVYINDGQIKLNSEKDTLLNEYSLVKGPKALFKGDICKEFLGLRENSFGSEALLKNKKVAYELFGEEVKYSKPTIEEIMIFLSHNNSKVVTEKALRGGNKQC
ncbi:sodium ABC transporter ATP-binding protein [Sporanaerobium hydrogeniformans]|uniref:Sodium ABC transporter ATP-binding protein n=1 Tax=Sporanaerobium hydrogeniformans TaxID=3072179 RepID=A0AC61DDE9_9FIRM|nr:ABC transporter ATP-binding protein [Sporanaerobium hydrogeniformans]PHV71229.1 sodium ABC transporter ATP-binding protein [Sporanaerobium hydrogeniformans]